MEQNTIQALPAASRKKGWAYDERRVAVVKVSDRGVRICTGTISTPGSHSDVDNIKKTVVWLDCPWRQADNADDAYEFVIEVTSPNLFGADEIGILSYPNLAKIWFGSQYSEKTINKICALTAGSHLSRSPEFLVESY